MSENNHEMTTRSKSKNNDILSPRLGDSNGLDEVDDYGNIKELIHS